MLDYSRERSGECPIEESTSKKRSNNREGGLPGEIHILPRVVVTTFFVLLFALLSVFLAIVADKQPTQFSSFLSISNLLEYAQAMLQKDRTCRLGIPFLEVFFSFGFLVGLVWGIALYTALRHQDQAEQNEISVNTTKPRQSPLTLMLSRDVKPSPLSFHELAYSHKQWAQLWFTIAVTIFLGAVLYAIFNVGYHICHVQKIDWPTFASTNLPNIFVFALFILAWQWSARHYRAHWHNFIVNAYRHRALWRYEEIEGELVQLAAGIDIPKGVPKEELPSINETVQEVRKKVADTLMELYRLSGVLLLVPSQSSYLESGREERTTEEIVRIEEILRPFIAQYMGPIHR